MGALVGRFFGYVANTTLPGRVSHPGVYAVVGASCHLISWTRAIPGILVTMFEITSDTSNVVPMIIFSMLSRSITNFFGLDGWAHAIFHENESLPKHQVHPVYWKDNETLAADERVVLNHNHEGSSEVHAKTIRTSTYKDAEHKNRTTSSANSASPKNDIQMAELNGNRSFDRSPNIFTDNPILSSAVESENEVHNCE